MKKLITSVLFFVACIPAWANDGIETVQSKHSFKETVDRLDKLLTAKGITVFAKFDHAAEAQKVGLTLRPTLVYAVGNPKAGTGIMVKSPSSAIDLPLKILVSEDGDGKVWLSYNAAEYLTKRHGIPEDVSKPLGAAKALANEVAGLSAIPSK